jgi:hypothetical protein
VPSPVEEFFRCPSCVKKFGNERSFEAHRAHGRCVDPHDLGQHEMFGVYWIPGSATQVNDWVDLSEVAETDA